MRPSQKQFTHSGNNCVGYWGQIHSVSHTSSVKGESLMIETVRTISQSQTAHIIQYLDEHIRDNLTVNPWGYAKGRTEKWLGIQSPITFKRGFVPGVPTQNIERLWAFLQAHWKACGYDKPFETALAVYGEKGIELHRDFTTLTSHAMTVNLGKTNFCYAKNRQTNELNEYTLNPGDVIKFDSKFSHCVPEPEKGRWAIIAWNVNINNPKVKAHYATGRARNPELPRI